MKIFTKLALLLLAFIVLSNNAFSLSPLGIIIENQGQWANSIKYLAKAQNLNVWVEDGKLTFDFFEISSAKDYQTINGYVKTIELMNFSNSLQYSINKGNFPLNYFLSSTDGMSTKASQELLIQNVYQGIDLKLYFVNDFLRYDFIVHQNGNYKDISLKVSDFDKISNNGESIHFETSNSIISHSELFVYQVNDKGNQIRINSSFYIDDKQNIRFDVDNYNQDLALVIDPLVNSTYIGGLSNEEVTAITTDATGNVIIAGKTISPNFPTTTGSYSQNFIAMYDLFISKLNSSLTQLIWSTYIGGGGNEEVTQIKVNTNTAIPLGIYFVGLTNSFNYPTVNAYDMTHNGDYDGFLTVLSNDGSELLYSTFIGGDLYDDIRSFYIDSFGSVYLAGRASSLNYPVTPNVYGAMNSGGRDIVVTKLNTNLNTLAFSTYIGTAQNEEAMRILVDANGNSFVFGRTNSAEFPVTNATFQQLIGGGNDAFILKLNNTGQSIIAASYIGGAEEEIPKDMIFDNNGNLILVGETNSGSYPTTDYVYSRSLVGNYDIFISKVPPDFSYIISSTYFGAQGLQYVSSVMINEANEVIIVGATNAEEFPTTNGAFSRTKVPTSWDIYVSRLDSSLRQLLYSTYIGGAELEAANAGVYVGNNNIYVGGLSNSLDFPIPYPAFSAEKNALADAIVFKLKVENYIMTVDNIEGEYCGGDAFEVIFTTNYNFLPDNIFTLEISNSTGSFDDAIELAEIESFSSETIDATLPDDLQTSSNYKVRIKSSHPIVFSNEVNISVLEKPDASISGDSVVQIDRVYDYSTVHVPGFSYIWNAEGGEILTNQNLNSIQVRWTDEESGSLTLKKTNPISGCYDSTYWSIRITPKTDFEIIGEDESCVYNEELYSVEEFPDAQYLWTAYNGTILGADNEREVLIKWQQIGTGEVKLVHTSGTGIVDTIRKSVRLGTIPYPEIIGVYNVCITKTETYRAVFVPGVENNWIVEKGRITGSSNAISVQVVWDTLGIGSITLTQIITETGCSNKLKQVVNIYTLPEVTLADFDDVCVNDPAFNLTQGLPTGGYYLGAGISNHTMFTPSEAGVGYHRISYLYTNENGCMDSTSKIITVRPAPESPILTYSSSETILRSSWTGTNIWFFEGSEIEDESSNEFTPTQNGQYSVVAVGTNGCNSLHSNVLDIDLSSVKDDENQFIQIYPNPAENQIKIEIFADEFSNFSMKISNILGETIKEFSSFLESGNNRFEFDVNSLAKGTYFVQLVIGNNIYTRRFVKY